MSGELAKFVSKRILHTFMDLGGKREPSKEVSTTHLIKVTRHKKQLCNVR